MTYEQYWEGPPSLAVAYRESFRMREEYNNRMAWLLGAYNFSALDRWFANIHFDNRHHDPVSYLDKPFELMREADWKEQLVNEKKEREEMVKKLDSLRLEYNIRKEKLNG